VKPRENFVAGQPWITSIREDFNSVGDVVLIQNLTEHHGLRNIMVGLELIKFYGEFAGPIFLRGLFGMILKNDTVG
jgi:hypothetical protein